MPVSSPRENQQKARVFLSYSRKDEYFIRRLAAALEDRGYTPIFDQSERRQDDPDLSLAAQNEWWDQLKAMIAAADVMVFVVTPASARSRACDDEIAHARNLGKRVIRIERVAIDHNTAPERLRALQAGPSFLSDEDAAFDAALAMLSSELDDNIDWRRRAAHWTRLANQWDAGGRSEKHLLPPGAADDADQWAASRPVSEPEPGPVVLALLEASRKATRENRERLLTITGRAFVKPAEQALADGRYDAALRLAAAGTLLGEDFDMRFVPERMHHIGLAAEAQSLRCVLHGHNDPVLSASFSPDASRIVTASLDATARVWDAATGCEVAVLYGHEDGVLSAAFSSDGARIVTASNDDTARLWDAATGHEISILCGHEGGLNSVAFDSKGVLVVTAHNDGTARLWDVATGTEIGILRGDAGWAMSAAFSPDGKRIIATYSDKTARVWDTAKGIEIAVLRGHNDDVLNAAFSPDGARVVTASKDETARVWDTAKGIEIAVLRGHDGSVQSATFSADGERIVTAGDSTARVWDADSGREITVLRGHEQMYRVQCAAFSPDGERIVTASNDETARVWDAASSREIRRVQGETKGGGFNPDDAEVVTISRGNTGLFLDAATGREIVILRGPDNSVRSGEFSPDGARVVAALRYHNTAHLWDAATGSEIARLHGHEGEIQFAGFSPDGVLVVTASSDGTFRSWDVSRTIALTCKRSPGALTALSSSAFTPSRTAAPTSDPVEILAASLTNGRGVKTESERHDLLMQAAPDDLYEALLERLTPAQRENVARRAEILARPLHPNCYSAPSAVGLRAAGGSY